MTDNPFTQTLPILCSPVQCTVYIVLYTLYTIQCICKSIVINTIQKTIDFLNVIEL